MDLVSDTKLRVVLIPNGGDNYCYYCYIDNVEDGFFVDVYQSGKAIKFAKDQGFTPKYVLTTHKHRDHWLGNGDMVKEFPGVKIIGGKADKVKACTDPVEDGDVITIGNINIKCMHTPCHTKGHTWYYVTIEGNTETDLFCERSKNEITNHPEVKGFSKCVFTGDTLFVGTVGKFFEGDATDMHSNLERLLGLPAETQVFPGHEYTIDSLNFCKTVSNL